MENNFLEKNRGKKDFPPQKKFNFENYKKNTFKSLKDVDYFLNNFQYYYKYFKLFKLFRK